MSMRHGMSTISAMVMHTGIDFAKDFPLEERFAEIEKSTRDAYYIDMAEAKRARRRARNMRNWAREELSKIDIIGALRALGYDL